MNVDAGTVPPVSYAHITALTSPHGIYEHAEYRMPRIAGGSCTDDAARALTVLAADPHRTASIDLLAERCLSMVESAVTPTGQAHNRLSPGGEWTDRPGTGDWWGRALAGLGAVIQQGTAPGERERALRAFLRAAHCRSADVRASAFAVVGAVRVLEVDPGCAPARALLDDGLDRIPREPTAGWLWSEPALRYANAALCTALIAGGAAQGSDATIHRGLALLTALLRLETAASGRLSVCGPAGRRPGQRGPLWDQQPIEPHAIGEACATALAVTGDTAWMQGVRCAWAWFLGDNDAHTVMYDVATGAGYDGLEPTGRNENCGAESTLAAIGTHQAARTLTEVLV